jgi:hypothetical protein
MERRQFINRALMAAGYPVVRGLAEESSKKELGIPGPYPGRVVAVRHPGSVISGAYQREPVRAMMRRGMMELTGAPAWTDAWRVFFEPGDVVIIKVNPVASLSDFCAGSVPEASRGSWKRIVRRTSSP